MKILRFLFIFILTSLLFSVVTTNEASADPFNPNNSNVINCYNSGGVFCGLDSGGATCQPGFKVPDSCASNPESCCTSQGLSSCDDVSCVPEVTYPFCNAGEVCTGLDATLCGTSGGRITDCSTASGFPGTCCEPSTSTTACSAGYVCNGLDPTPCSTGGGYQQACENSAGSPGTCCFPGEEPPPPTTAGEYYCEWIGGKCGSNLESELQGCTTNNTGRCLPNMVGCTACEEITTEGACTANGGIRSCVEYDQGQTGYWCAGASAGGCYLCFPESADPDSPEYKPECDPPQYTTPDACTSACSGHVPTRFNCIKNQCAESQFGVYSNLGECATFCKGAEVFCVDNDPDVRTADPASQKIATAIGCIPINDSQATAIFFLKWGIGISGGIALILLAYSGFMIMTASGDPRRLQAGKELLTAAISGIILLIMSAYILRIAGLDILQIPGFGL